MTAPPVFVERFKKKAKRTYVRKECYIMANFMKRGSKWQARITWRDDLGKLRQKSKLGFETKQQAKQWAIEQEKKHIDGQLTDNDPAFANYFDEWFSTYKKDKISLSTQRLYFKTSERIHKHWGNKKISDVTRRQYVYCKIEVHNYAT